MADRDPKQRRGDGGDPGFLNMRALFLQALERPVEERGAFLREACAGDAKLEESIQSLLDAHHDMGGFLANRRSEGAPGESAAEEEDPLLGATVGDYRVLSLIARGGMGAVYRAEQEHPRREVALKLVDRYFATPELLRRFELEAQLLARLKHPGIAQIYVAGTTGPGLGDRPFFAMELVDGLPLTDYVKERSLDQRSRLKLVIKICAAVQHAHQVGVIHRDLKPANILVTAEGEPKVLDFGVARSTDANLQVTTIDSGQSSLVGTLPYMSPEQVRGNPDELDTRSDVHALGILAYELLTGRLPRDVEGKPMTEAIRIIARQDARTLVRAGKGRFAFDLETIVAKALASDRDKRYDSASGLAADLQRFLDGQPISARPPSTFYQLRKLVARNRLPAALVGGLIVVAVASAVITAFQARRIAGEREPANLALETASETAAFLESLFLHTDPEQTLGRDLTALDLLDQGAERIHTELQDQPMVRGRLQGMLGKVYEGLGKLDRAEPLLEEAVILGRKMRAELGPHVDHTNLVLALPMLARCRLAAGKNKEAIALCRELREVAEAVHGTESETYATALNHLGYQLSLVAAHTAEAREVIREGYDLRVRLLGPDHSDTAWSVYQYAWILRSAGEKDEARAEFERAYEIWRKALPANHPQLANCLTDYAGLLQELGEHDEATALAERALAIQTETLGEGHPALAVTLGVIGTTFWRKGDSQSALEYYQASTNLLEASVGPSDLRFTEKLLSVAFLHGELNQMEEREAVLRRVLALCREHHAGLPQRLSEATGVLGEFLLARGKHAEAVSLLWETHDLLQAIGPSRDQTRRGILDALDYAVSQVGTAEEALAVHRRRLALREAHPEWTKPDPRHLRYQCGLQLLRLGRHAEAEAELVAVLAALGNATPEDGFFPSNVRWLLAHARQARGAGDEARQLYETALDVDPAQLSDGEHWYHLRTAQQHAVDGRLEEAKRELAAAGATGLTATVGRMEIDVDPRLSPEARRALIAVLENE